MKYSKFSESYWQISVRSLNHIEHDAMSWTIHWLEAVLVATFLLDEEDILLVFEVMPTHFPEFSVVEVRRNNFIVTTDFILPSH